MSLQRFEPLDMARRELFTAIYGLNGSSEVYITPDLRIHNMREALYLHLKEQGYSTIFYDEKAFSYEEEPLLKFFNFTAKGQSDNPTPTKRDFFKGKGPMNKTRNMDTVSASTAQANVNETHHDAIRIESIGNQKRYIVNQSEGIFKDVFAFAQRCPKENFAIVFVSPSTLSFDSGQRKTIVNKWNDLKTDFKRNKFAFRIITLYDFDSVELFTEAFNSASDELFFLSPFKELILSDIGREDKETGKIIEGRKDKTIFYLGAPGRDEISHILNYRRLRLQPDDEEGLPHLFGKVSWDYVVLRLWQGALSGKTNISLISEYFEYDKLDKIIEEMDTVRSIDLLNKLEGIDNIKEQFALYRQALYANKKGENKVRFRPHMALMGSPGTGKSTVARLFGDILREDGLLPKGHFVKVSTDELIGQYIGETRPKTRTVCERARGGVLFIDEAYGLMSGKNSHGDADFGAEAIEVLIQFMEDNDDSLVILAGYTDKINYLIDKGNEGFRRRFNDLGFFVFRDYSPEVLYKISSGMIKMPTTEDFQKALKVIIRCKWAYRNTKFGNVGEMENLISKITNHYASLNTQEPLDIKHLPEDLRRLVDDDLLSEDILFAELKDIIGQQNVKTVINDLFTKVRADHIKMRNIPNYTPEMPKLDFLFTGNPGTGKTTIARIIGHILQKLGVFPSSEGDILTEVSGNVLLAKTPADMENLFEDNIGKILFIDEAYQLKESPRVVADIVANMEKLEYKNKLSIIMAGYSKDMQQLKNVNAGFTRRFKNVPFTDYTNEELYEILVRKIKSSANTVIDADECKEIGVAYFASLTRGVD